MQAKLRAYMDHLFSQTRPTKAAVELKEEMLQNLTDKYNDLLAEGKSPEAAYNIATASIGDISELLAQLKQEENQIPATPRNRFNAAVSALPSASLSLLCCTYYVLFPASYGSNMASSSCSSWSLPPPD